MYLFCVVLFLPVVEVRREGKKQSIEVTSDIPACFFFFWRNSKTLLESQFLQSHIFTCIFCVLMSFSLFSLTLFVIPFRWHWWDQRRSSRTDQCQSSRMEGRRKSWYCSRGKECDCSLSHSVCDQQVNNIVKTCTLKTSALPVTAVNLPSC